MADNTNSGICATSIDGVMLCRDCALRDDEPVAWQRRRPRGVTHCGRCGEPLIARPQPAQPAADRRRANLDAIARVSAAFSARGFRDLAVTVDDATGAITVWATAQADGRRAVFRGATVAVVAAAAEHARVHGTSPPW
jgi:hypothetical protein